MLDRRLGELSPRAGWSVKHGSARPHGLPARGEAARLGGSAVAGEAHRRSAPRWSWSGIVRDGGRLA